MIGIIHLQKLKRLALGLVILVAGAGSALSDDFVINGAATTTNDGNVIDGNDTLTVTESGSISTIANNAVAIESTGDRNTLLNRGMIETRGDLAPAIVH